jgi:hypothetical protein
MAFSMHADDVLNKDWIKYRMVRSHRLLSLVLVHVLLNMVQRILIYY